MLDSATMHCVTRWWLTALLLALPGATCIAAEADFEGTVTKVFDGDSFLVRPAEGKDIDVRLLDIDAPEKGQPHADVARTTLRRMIEGRRVFVDVIDTDKFDRKLARVYRLPDRLDLARQLLHDGHVWVYRTVNDRALLKLQAQARAAKIGLWSLPETQRIPPWQFRYAARRNKATETSGPTPLSP